MNFELTDRWKALRERLLSFMDERVYPAEPIYENQLALASEPHTAERLLERRW
jgi:acyl-CoA dehydrogenase